MPLSASAIAQCLADQWGLVDARLTPHHGGMNSETWFVDVGGEPGSTSIDGRPPRVVAKAVPLERRQSFATGLATAGLVEAAGIPAGSAISSVSGDLVVELEGHALGLLSFVEGIELSGRGVPERRMIGMTLGLAHRALVGIEMADADRFHWVDPDADHLGLQDWLLPAVTSALAALDRLRPSGLTWGMLHTDPAPEAFRFDAATGITGLIDWDTGLFGPLLYDVASAVLYVGGPDESRDLIDSYLGVGVLAADEVARGLLPMLRFRWAVQADYFARRLATDDLTGIVSRADNERGLDDARRWLSQLTDGHSTPA